MSLKRKVADISRDDEARMNTASPLASAYGFVDVDQDTNIHQRPPQASSSTPAKGTSNISETGKVSQVQAATQDQATPKSDTVEMIDLDSDDDAPEYEVEKILATRYRKRVLQYNVKWKGWSDENNTWEPEANLTGAAEAIREYNETMKEKKRKAKLQEWAGQAQPQPQTQAQASSSKPFKNFQPQSQYAVLPPNHKYAAVLPPGFPVLPSNAIPSTITQRMVAEDSEDFARLKAQVEELKAQLALKSAPTAAQIQSRVIPAQRPQQSALTAPIPFTTIGPIPSPQNPGVLGKIIEHRPKADGEMEFRVTWTNQSQSGSIWMPESYLLNGDGQLELAFYRAGSAFKVQQSQSPQPVTPSLPPLPTQRPRDTSEVNKRIQIPEDVDCIVDQRQGARGMQYLVRTKTGKHDWIWFDRFVTARAEHFIDEFTSRTLKAANHKAQDLADALHVSPSQWHQNLKNVAQPTNALLSGQQSLLTAMNAATSQLNGGGPTSPPKSQGAIRQAVVVRDDMSGYPSANDDVRTDVRGPQEKGTQLMKPRRGRPPKGLVGNNSVQPSIKAPNTRVVDLTEEVVQPDKQKQAGPITANAPQAKSKKAGKKDQPQYLLVAPDRKKSARPLPNGPYSRHTVASEVLLAMGKHPWLSKLNTRLEGLLDIETSTHRALNAQEQHQRGLKFIQRIEAVNKGKPPPPLAP